MNGKRIMVGGAITLAIGILAGIAGSVLFGEEKGGAADLVHLAQLALLGAGLLFLVVGVVTHLVAGRRTVA